MVRESNKTDRTSACVSLRLGVLPLPEIIGPVESTRGDTAEGCMLDTILCTDGGPVIQSNLEQRHLDQNHDHSLSQQGRGIIFPKPVKDPKQRVNFNIPRSSQSDALGSHHGRIDSQGGSYFKIDATSMINGMSSENPAELLFRLMLRIWSK